MSQGVASADRTWTLLLYMGPGADEGFEQIQNEVLDAIKAVDFKHVELVYQFARKTRVERGRIRDKKRTILATSPPIDITDPGPLTQFLDWAGEKFPSRYTALFAKDHGQGPIDRRLATVLTAAGIFQDRQMRYMPMPSFRRAIERSRAGRVDMLGLDVCRLGSIEVAYELRELASCLVVSESTEVTTGWAYPAIMEYLDREHDLVTPRGLAAKVVEHSKNFRLAAVELAWVKDVATAIDALGKELLDGSTSDLLAWVMKDFPQVLTDGVQIEELVKLLAGQKLCKTSTLEQITRTLKRALLHDHVAAGIGLYFPTTKGSPNLASYGEGKFAGDTSWGEFLGTLNYWLQ